MDIVSIAGMIPIWIKIAYTAFVCLLVPIYWRNWGLANFLWFSDIALLTTVVALWTESRLLASMMTVAVLLPEAAWNLSFFGRLLTGHQIAGLTGYMFDANRSRFLRSLSLFHIFLPILLVGMVWRLGYDSRAWLVMTLLAWIVLLITYFFTKPSENINWVFGPGKNPQKRIPPLAYLGLVMLFFPICVYLPTHLLLQAIFA